MKRTNKKEAFDSVFEIVHRFFEIDFNHFGLNDKLHWGMVELSWQVSARGNPYKGSVRVNNKLNGLVTK